MIPEKERSRSWGATGTVPQNRRDRRLSIGAFVHRIQGPIFILGAIALFLANHDIAGGACVAYALLTEVATS